MILVYHFKKHIVTQYAEVDKLLCLPEVFGSLTPIQLMIDAETVPSGLDSTIFVLVGGVVPVVV